MKLQNNLNMDIWPLFHFFSSYVESTPTGLAYVSTPVSLSLSHTLLILLGIIKNFAREASISYGGLLDSTVRVSFQWVSAREAGTVQGISKALSTGKKNVSKFSEKSLRSGIW